jgi:hypothetical protein
MIRPDRPTPLRLLLCTTTLAMALLAPIVAHGQEQQCPGTDPQYTSVCQDQYNSCWSDNEGKNCDFHTCAAFCDNAYDECLYGVHEWPSRENLVISRSVDTSTFNGDGCVDGCSSWGCCTFWGVWDPYRKYDTHWQILEHQHRRCDDGYQYDTVTLISDHPDDICYQHDDSCYDTCPGGTACHYHLDCLNSWKQFTADGTHIIIH